MVRTETKAIGLPPSAEDILPTAAPAPLQLGIEEQQLGFYTSPISLSGGEVLKPYRGDLTTAEATGLQQLHSAFVADLQGIGIRIPKTTLLFRGDAPKLHAEIVQEKFEPQHLTRAIVKWGERDFALQAALSVADDALKYLTSDLRAVRGFHPTFRNYAFRDGQAYMIDTFPPFASRAETHQLMIRHAPDLPTKFLLRIGGNFIRLYSDEYYETGPMLGGLVASMHRQRPELAQEFQARLVERAKARGLPDLAQLEEQLRSQPKNLWRFRLAGLLRVARGNYS